MAKLETAKGLVAIKSLCTKNSRPNNLIELRKLRKLAIEWIKRDIEMSEDSYLNSDKGKEYRKYAYKLPNGRFCSCDPEEACDFHTKGKRLMEFFNIAEKELT